MKYANSHIMPTKEHLTATTRALMSNSYKEWLSSIRANNLTYSTACSIAYKLTNKLCNLTTQVNNIEKIVGKSLANKRERDSIKPSLTTSTQILTLKPLNNASYKHKSGALL